MPDGGVDSLHNAPRMHSLGRKLLYGQEQEDLVKVVEL
jgi:hypothetical protein